MKDILKAVARILGAIADAVNRHNKKAASTDAANTIANRSDGERVQQSSESFEDLARRLERDRVE